MKSYQECIPCMARQVWRSARMAVEDRAVQEETMRTFEVGTIVLKGGEHNARR